MTLTEAMPAGKPSPMRTIAELVADSKSKDWRVRASAVGRLGESGDIQALEPLLAALHDEDQEVCALAAKALGKLGNKAAVQPLIAQLADSKSSVWPVREYTVEALGKLGDRRALEALKDALSAEGLEAVMLRESAAIALGRVADKRACEALRAALKDKYVCVRLAAATALGRLKDRGALAALTQLLDSDEADDREAAIKALAEIGDTGATDRLLPVLEDADSQVRRITAEALDTLKWKPANDCERAAHLVAKQDWAKLEGLGLAATKSLIACLGDADDKVGAAASETLAKYGAAVMDELAAALRTQERGRSKGAIARTLAAIGAPAFDTLIACLKVEDDFIPFYATIGLAELGDKRALVPLAEAMRKSERGLIHKGAADALVQLGWSPPTPTEAVTCLLAAEKWDLLRKLGPAAIDPLIAKLKGEATFEGTTLDTNGLVAALQILVQIGGKRAFEPLVALLDGEGPEGSLAAIDALGDLGDERAAEPLAKVLHEMADPKKHLAVIRALGSIGSERAIEALVAALDRDELSMRGAAAEELAKLKWKPSTTPQAVAYLIAKNDWPGLKKLGAPAVDHLIGMLSSRVPFTAECAATALGQVGDRRALAPLVAALKPVGLSGPYFPEAAAEALGRIGDVSAVESLLGVVKQEYDERLLAAAAEAMGRLGDKRAIGPLTRLLDHSHFSVRVAAARALCARDWQPREPALAAQCLLLARRWKALTDLGPVAVPTLISGLDAEDDDVRVSAVQSLGKIVDRRAIAPLVDHLADWPTRGHAADALDALEWRPAKLSDWIHLLVARKAKQNLLTEWRLTREVLLAGVRSEKGTRVRYAVNSLVALGKQAMIPKLIAILDSEENTENTQMAEAFLNCGHPELQSAAVWWAMRNRREIKDKGGEQEVRWGEM